MQLQGESLIAAPRSEVWAALNDPAVLARCIEGVESLERVEANRFEGILNARVGPVKAKFAGGVELTEIDAPNRYVLVGEGKGGVAGFAKGSAEVVLEDAPGGGTLLRYDARSQVGGKLAQLGSRLVEGAARGYAEAFFTALRAEVENRAPETVSMPEPAAEDQDAIRAAATRAAVSAVTDPRRGLPGWVWIGGLVLLTLAVLLMLV